jgi:2-polyprenyl-3-methyl-5-hydroxy-6-metoxy-1,4-benzoquinol methylase
MSFLNFSKKPYESVVECDLCGGKKFSLVGSFDSAEWDLIKKYYLENEEENNPFLKIPQKFNLLKCNSCGLSFVNPRINDDVVNRFYREYFSGKYRDYIHSYDSLFREDVYREYFKMIKPFLPSIVANKKFLDIGCATGEFMKVVSENGFSSMGIDVVSDSLKKAKNYGEVLIGDALEQLEKIREKSLFLVVMVDSIEHLASPRRVLELVNEKMEEGGIIFIETPNLENGSDIMSRHFHLFSQDTIVLALKKCGFETVLIKKGGGKYNPGDRESDDRFLVVVAKKIGDKV